MLVHHLDIAFTLQLGNIEREMIELVQQCLYNYQIVSLILGCIKWLTDEYLEIPVGLLSRLIRDAEFVKQFVDSGGLESKTVHSLLQQNRPTGVLVDTLLVLTQVAR